MQIRDTFITKIQERIEPVVKVAERRPTILLDELQNLVLTPQWERYLHQALQEYTEAFENEEEQGIGIWISGFFGSGKSLLMKMLGILLEGGELEGRSVHDIFLNHLPDDSLEVSDIRRFLALCQRRITCSAIGGNIHAQLTDTNDTLTLITFRLFAKARGYTHIWPFAWGVEYQLDARGLLPEFRQIASTLCSVGWNEIAGDAEFYSAQLYEAAATVLPKHFRNPAAVEQATDNAQRSGITPEMLVERLRRWCKEQDTAGKRHKILLQLDELGQWIQGGLNVTGRIMQVQALVESASTFGAGRVWIAVTAHGDIQALKQNVQQEDYAKINQRFILKCKLSNEDINTVVQERLLRKTIPAASQLRELFQQDSVDLYDLGALKETQRVYPVPDTENFALHYPYMPWTVAVIPDVTKGIAQTAGRGEELTGSSRTMIAVVQGGILETRGFLDKPVGRFISLADLYTQFVGDVPIETKTDLSRVRDTVDGGNDSTTKVAHALYLLGQASYIPCTLDNVARALITSINDSIAALRPQVKIELDRLVKAGYAKHIGESYIFLSTQQRSFQEKVQAKQEEFLNRTNDLIMKLKERDMASGDDALRFDQVPISGMAGRTKLLRLMLDGSVLRNPFEHVTIQVYSTLQQIIAPEIGNLEEMKQRSRQDPNSFFLRMDNVQELRYALAQAAATEEVADQVMNSGSTNNPEYEFAKQAKSHDVTEYRRDVRYHLARAVRDGIIFFRGSAYYPTDGENASAVIRNSLSQLLPQIYSRFNDLPHHIRDDARAVKDALNNVTSNSDLVTLKVYKADGTLNDGNPLLSTLRSRIPLANDDMGMVSAEQLQLDLEKPPFGWDGNCVRVGLALLLRASACHLVENGNTHTDPSNPIVLNLLTKAQLYKTVRVQGIRTEIGIKELQEIRGYIETIFGVKPALVTAIMNDKLKEQLHIQQKQAQDIEAWASTAVCSLPLQFASGNSLVQELLDSNALNVRLPHFMREWETLMEYIKLLRNLSHFRIDHGKEFVIARGFFNNMLFVDNPPDEVRNFVQSWRVLEKERIFTDPIRWSELMQAYHTAQQALTDQIHTLQQEAQKELGALEASLAKRVKEVGIPATDVDPAITELQTLLNPLRDRVQRTAPTIAEARNLQTALMRNRMDISKKVHEIRARYQTPEEPPAQPEEVYMSWHNILGQRHITSPDDLKPIIESIQRSVYNELEKHHIVIIE
jgi:hypothetical protein